MRNRVLVLAAVAACAGPRPRAPSGEVVFSVTGRVEHGPYRFGQGDLGRLHRRGFRAVTPVSGAEARFEGVAVGALLQDSMDLEKDADTAVFHGRGGYRAAVPLAAVRQLKPVLADRVNGAAVGAWRSDSAPLVLAWPNVEAPGIDSDPRMRWWWVSGVTKLELVSWIATYGRALRVPQGASDEARLGADVIATQCMECHRVRGVGGTGGRELTGAAGRDLESFAASLRVHLQKAGMASAPEVTPAAARQIAAFLRAVEVSGGKSEEEGLPVETPPPPQPRGY